MNRCFDFVRPSKRERRMEAGNVTGACVFCNATVLSRRGWLYLCFLKRATGRQTKSFILVQRRLRSFCSDCVLLYTVIVKRPIPCGSHTDTPPKCRC